MAFSTSQVISSYLDHQQAILSTGVKAQKWENICRKYRQFDAQSQAHFEQWLKTSALECKIPSPHSRIGYADPEWQALYCIWCDAMLFAKGLIADQSSAEIPVSDQLFFICNIARGRGRGISVKDLYANMESDANTVQRHQAWNAALKAYALITA